MMPEEKVPNLRIDVLRDLTELRELRPQWRKRKFLSSALFVVLRTTSQVKKHTNLIVDTREDFFFDSSNLAKHLYKHGG